MCLLCYGRELEKHIEKVAKSGGKLTEEFEYSQLLCVDSLLSAYGEKRVRWSHFSNWFVLPAAVINVAFRGAPNRMSKAEIDARVKAVDKDLEQNPTEDKAQLIRNYGLTQADYERCTSKSQSLSTLIDHRPKAEYKKSTPRKVEVFFMISSWLYLNRRLKKRKTAKTWRWFGQTFRNFTRPTIWSVPRQRPLPTVKITSWLFYKVNGFLYQEN